MEPVTAAHAKLKPLRHGCSENTSCAVSQSQSEKDMCSARSRGGHTLTLSHIVLPDIIFEFQEMGLATVAEPGYSSSVHRKPVLLAVGCLEW